MKHRLSLIHMPFLLTICLLLAACTSNPFQSSTGGQTPTTEVVTQPVPPTQTECPADRGIRPMVTAPLALGKNPQIIYIPDDGDLQIPPKRIVRYNVTTRATIDIVSFSEHESIRSAFLSADQQWLIIQSLSRVEELSRGEERIQAVRVDGQGLQTLLCRSVGSLTLSPDRRWIGYTLPIQYPGSADKFYLVDLTTGKERIAVDIPKADVWDNVHNPRPSLWLSNNQVYLTDMSGLKNPQTYLLDINKGENQALETLPVVVKQPYRNATTDGTHLFINEVECSNGETSCTNTNITKSSIMRLPAQGGTAETIFQQDSLIITDITLINQQTVLILADNQSEGKREIWTVKTDGSEQDLLVSASASTTVLEKSGFFAFDASWPSASISPDDTQFIVSGWPTENGEAIQLGSGSLQAKQITPLLEITSDTRVIGWTLL